jgi:Ni,Fe-hydrogenase III small subunit
MSALIDMRTADQLMYLPGVTVVTGDAPLPAGVSEKNLVSVGLCMKEKANRHVKGCPPNNALVVKAIIGDRAEVKRMYADESLDQSDS